MVIYSHWHDFRQIKVTWKTRLLNIQCAVNLSRMRDSTMFYQTSGKMMTCLLRMRGCSPLQLHRQHAGDHQMLSPVFWCVTAIKTPEALKFLTADNPHEELTQEHHIAALVQFTSPVLKNNNKKKQPPQKKKTGWFPVKTFDCSTELFCLQIGSKSG